MSETNKVVAHFLDGGVLKGTTWDFSLGRPAFHVSAPGSDEVQTVRFELLKAVFFVKELAGHRERRDFPRFERGNTEKTKGTKVSVLFRDGELLCGYAPAFAPAPAGFILSIADPRSNNLRVYVLFHATKEIGVGPEAEALVRRMRRNKAA
jgi:uncharacterized protein DUF6982